MSWGGPPEVGRSFLDTMTIFYHSNWDTWELKHELQLCQANWGIFPGVWHQWTCHNTHLNIFRCVPCLHDTSKYIQFIYRYETALWRLVSGRTQNMSLCLSSECLTIILIRGYLWEILTWFSYWGLFFLYLGLTLILDLGGHCEWWIQPGFSFCSGHWEASYPK